MKQTKKADILFLCMIIMNITVPFILGFMGQYITLTLNQSLIFSQFLILLPAVFYFFITRTNPVRLISFKPLDFASAGMIFLMTVLIMPLVTFLNALSMLFSENIVNSMTDELSHNPVWVNLALMAVLPALSEELVFRGVFHHTYRKRSILYGALLSGIIFGLMHLNFNQFSYAFALGIIFAFMVEATGSILAPMIAHFIINGNSVVMMKLSEALQGSLEKNPYYETAVNDAAMTSSLMVTTAVMGVIAIFTTSLAIGVFIWLSKHCGRQEHIRNIIKQPRKEHTEITGDMPEKLISIPMGLAIILCIGFMIFMEVM